MEKTTEVLVSSQRGAVHHMPREGWQFADRPFSSPSLQGLGTLGLQGLGIPGLQELGTPGLQGLRTLGLQVLETPGLQGLGTPGLQCWFCDRLRACAILINPVELGTMLMMIKVFE